MADLAAEWLRISYSEVQSVQDKSASTMEADDRFRHLQQKAWMVQGRSGLWKVIQAGLCWVAEGRENLTNSGITCRQLRQLRIRRELSHALVAGSSVSCEGNAPTIENCWNVQCSLSIEMLLASYFLGVRTDQFLL